MTITPLLSRPEFSILKSIFATSLLCLAAAPVSAQTQIEIFLNNSGGSELVNSNLGQSAIAINRTCGQLAMAGGFMLTDPNAEELFLRCNELVFTADAFNGNTSPVRTLGYTDGDELLSAFAQVNGEENQAASTMAASASSDQFSSIAARLGALRGASSSSLTAATANAAEFMYGSGGGAAADDGMAFSPWGWFVRGTYASGDRDPSDATGFTGAEDGFDFDQYGFTVGIDRASNDTVWGVALTYSSYEVTMDNRGTPNSTTSAVEGGKIEADSVNASFYFDFNSQNNTYFSVLTGFGNQSFDMARNFIYFAPAPTANAGPLPEDQARLITASPDGDSLSASLTVGRLFQRGGVVIDPRFGLTVDRVTIDQFAEVDSGNIGSGASSAVSAMQLAFGEQKIDSMRANIGVQVSNNINTSFGSVRPTFSLDWYHEFEDDAREINVKYALEDELVGLANTNFKTGFDGCTSCFRLRSEAPDSDFFVLGAGLAAAFQNGLQGFAMLEGLLGYDKLSAYSLTLGLRGQF